MIVIPQRILITVLAAIDLNDQPCFRAEEVCDVVPDRLLTAEPQAPQTTCPQRRPESLLRVCHLPPEFACPLLTEISIRPPPIRLAAAPLATFPLKGGRADLWALTHGNNPTTAAVMHVAKFPGMIDQSDS